MIKRMMKVALTALTACVLFALTAAPAAARDGDFDPVVRHIEKTYKTKRVNVPFMGLARLAVRVAKPEGVKGFKLATFENLSMPGPNEEARLGEGLRRVLSPAWQPLVRVRARGGEQTYVYLREDGKNIKLLVVSIEPTEATVVRVKIGRDALARWMNDPGKLGLKLPSAWGE